MQLPLKCTINNSFSTRLGRRVSDIVLYTCWYLPFVYLLIFFSIEIGDVKVSDSDDYLQITDTTTENVTFAHLILFTRTNTVLQIVKGW
jgi:hypothetical protein